MRPHDVLYYVLDRPEISDEAYDRIFGELERLEDLVPVFPVILGYPAQRPVSPGRRAPVVFWR